MTQVTLHKEGYRKLLKEGDILSSNTMNRLLGLFDKKRGLEIDSELPKKLASEKPGLTSLLTNLKLCVATGNPSWEGLVVGFPGSKEELSTAHVGTPYIREILYPILDLYVRLNKEKNRRMPCLYLLGDRFNDVFLRKFRLLNSVVPHVIILTNDLLKSADEASNKIIEKKPKITEKWIQSRLCEKMREPNGFSVQAGSRSMRIGYIAHEVSTYEGTMEPERLDILGYDKDDHSLVAFEIKGPDCGRVQLENLFLQGVEHRNWLEENKMAVKFVFEGPRGKTINTKKRARLILGFCGEDIPKLFGKLQAQAKKDKYLNIDFCRFIAPTIVSGNLNFIS